MAKPLKLPPGVSMTAEGKFRVRIYWRGTQHSIGAYYTLGDAKAAMAIARSEMARGIFIPPSQMRQNRASQDVLDAIAATTVREWAEDWLSRLEGAERSPGTLRSYASTLNAHILPALGYMRLVDVTSADVDAMLDTLKAKPGAWTNVARTTRAMFLAAVSAGAGGITVSPVTTQIASNRQKVSQAFDRDELATIAEVQAFAKAMPPALRLAVILGAWCSMRQGEVLGLQRRDFRHLEDPQSATVSVERQWNAKASPPGYTAPKAGSRRTMAIHPDHVPLILAHLKTYTPDEDDAPVFPRPTNPRLPVSQSAFDKAWRAARDTVRPGFRFHSLRHTGLTEYARSGATLAELKARGGHRSNDVSMRYQHATIERDRTNVAKMKVTGE